MFYLEFTKGQIRSWLREGVGTVDQVYSILWALKWFRRIKRPPGDRHKYWYTCTLLDRKTSRCRHYELRPPVCRKFLCREAPEETVG